MASNWGLSRRIIHRSVPVRQYYYNICLKTGVAIYMCTGLFFGRFATDVMFQPGNGDRFNVPNYLVILTDGNSDNATATWNEAMKARAAGINIICVSTSLFISVFLCSS